METFKILVPVDFSSCSVNALQNAVMLAKEKKAKLFILNAFLVPAAFSQDPGYIIGDQIGELEKEIKHDLKNLLLLIPDLKKVDHKFILEHAHSTDAIISYTLKNKVDLVIMGTRGKSTLAKTFLGSNTYAVINSVKCPVLAIPEEGNISRIRKIILAVDYEKLPAPAVFEPLIDLGRLFNAQINILHIGQNKKLDRNEIFEGKNLERYFKNINHRYKYIVGIDEEKKILEYLKEQKGDLLAMISKKHTFLEKLQFQSLTKKMVLNIKTPIMVLHDQE